MTKKPTGKHAIVIGGFGGLFTGILLRSIGWDVNITNASSTISTVERGIVLQ